MVNCFSNPLRTFYFPGTLSRNPWTSPESTNKRINAWPNKGLPDPDTDLHSFRSVLETLLSLHMLGCPRDPSRRPFHLSLLSSLHSFMSLDLQPVPLLSPRSGTHGLPSSISPARLRPNWLPSSPLLPLHPHRNKENCFTPSAQATNSGVFLTSHPSVRPARCSSKAPVIILTGAALAPGPRPST